MFKSIHKSGRIAAVAIGLIAALSPLAAPPAALASGSAPTPELEKSYNFKVSSEYSDIRTNGHTKFGYLYDCDDDFNRKTISLINFDDGSMSPIDISDECLDYAYLTDSDQSTGKTVIIYSYSHQTTRPKQSIPSLRPNMPTPM